MNSSNSWSLKNTHSVSNPLMNNPAHKLSQISSLLGKRQLVTEKYTPFTKLGDHQKKKIAVRFILDIRWIIVKRHSIVWELRLSHVLQPLVGTNFQSNVGLT